GYQIHLILLGGDSLLPVLVCFLAIFRRLSRLDFRLVGGFSRFLVGIGGALRLIATALCLSCARAFRSVAYNADLVFSSEIVIIEFHGWRRFLVLADRTRVVAQRLRLRHGKGSEESCQNYSQ